MAPATLPQAVSEPSASRVTARHYQAMCGLALAAIFLVQVQHSPLGMPITLLANLFVVFIGMLGILYRVRLNPIFALFALAVPQLIEQSQVFSRDQRGARFLDVADVIVCVGVLTYLIGQYRLHGLWFHVVPLDPRVPAERQTRSQGTLSLAELSALIFPIPICVLLAEIAALLLKQPWSLGKLPTQWNQFLAVAWVILLALFLSAHAFRYWRRRQMDRVSAQLLLQDVLWQQTRGEQRRVNRWLAWKHLQAKKSE